MTILALHTALPGLCVATAHFAHLFREFHGRRTEALLPSKNKGPDTQWDKTRCDKSDRKGGREWDELKTRKGITKESSN